jgi:hypothetical protein
MACEACGEHRPHYERIRGRVDTREESRELVCSECRQVTRAERTRAPVIRVRVDVELP